jgi:hypothetical protein
MAQYVITNEPGRIDFECDSDMLERTLQNAKNLLMLRKGEVPFDRQRGLDRALFDLPLSEAEEALLPELDRVMLWEPDVEVVSAEFDTNAAGETIIRCVIETEIE